MEIDGAAPKQRLSLPVWTPGSYMVREFAQHIVAIEARENGQKIDVHKVDKNCFELGNINKKITIHYQVYGFDSSIRSAFIDGTQAFFNGCALFLRAHGFEQSPHLLRLNRASVPLDARWQVATGMPAVDVDNRGFGSYGACNYDELVDYPFQISEMKRLAFTVKSVPHEIVLVGDVRPFNEQRLVCDLTALCENHINLFGGIAPFSSYTFLARFEEGGYGGLEHRNSTMLLSSPLGLPKTDGQADAHYRNFLGLCSHEYFHAWNIKRLKPKSFVPFDYDKECYTTLLWLFEGITSYYDDLALVRAGLISRADYFDMMAKNYSKLLKNRGRFVQSLADASFDAWIKFYRTNENSNNVTTSYYLKGSFVAFYIDLLIQTKSHGKHSLDQVMQAAYVRYGQEGISEEEFCALLDEIGGVDSADIKQRFVYGTEDVNLAPLLAHYGVQLITQPDEFAIDDRTKMQSYLGFKFRFDDNGRALISQVDYDSPALIAGLSPNDEIVAINNIRFDPSNAADFLASIAVSDTVSVLYSRKKMIKTCQITAQGLPITRASMTMHSSLTEQQRHALASWLDPV